MIGENFLDLIKTTIPISKFNLVNQKQNNYQEKPINIIDKLLKTHRQKISQSQRQKVHFTLESTTTKVKVYFSP